MWNYSLTKYSSNSKYTTCQRGSNVPRNGLVWEMHFPPEFKTIYPFLTGFSPLSYFSSVLPSAGTVLACRRCFCLLVFFFLTTTPPASSFALRSVWVSFKLSTAAHTCGPDGGLMEGEGSARWFAISLCVFYLSTLTQTMRVTACVRVQCNQPRSVRVGV